MFATPRLLAGLLGLSLVFVPGTVGAKEEPFPAHGLLPKQETGAARFLEANPDADGSGVVVAIFDTGVDPGARGLQKTTGGQPKVIDVVDATGSGDVDTSETAEAEKGALEGLSGRTLTLDPKWKNPTKTWRIGLKAMAELFPAEMLPRLEKKRAKLYRAQHRVAVTKLQAEVDKAKADEDANEGDVKDLEARLKTLRKLGDTYKDPGPIVDCVVWHDGTEWWGVVDTDEDGDLADETAMRNYRTAREWATFDKESNVNYCLNIHDEGNTLSIVVDSGDHGTHVAGIVAAHFPDQPELNGIAPGAQIVSVKIGDTRMKSSSFGTGAERGMVAVLRNKCDLINMSYGGADRRPNVGRDVEIYRELVNKHGVIFVSSAGNEGPALSTVGGPGGTTDAIFGVGAYVTPSMAKAQMGVRGNPKGTHFTWSSRGPTLDGALGVDFTAPGGAVAPVPTWSLQRTMQMNGTSMSAPNACGGIALLVSAMKAREMRYSPDRVRRAIVNTAAPIEGEDVWSAGAGMIQIDRAFDHLLGGQARPQDDVRFEVGLPRRGNVRGLYLREPYDLTQAISTSVRVKPHLHEDRDHKERVDLEMRFALESTQPWIECATHLQLNHGGSYFGIKVDPTGLPPGAHYGEIRAYDVGDRSRGVYFRVPVTVVKPQPLADPAGTAWRETLTFDAGTLHRRFFAAPIGATWADLTVRAKKAPVEKLFVFEATQLAPGRAYAERHREVYARLREGEVEGFAFPVEGGRTLELAMSQYWSYVGEADYELELSFHGIRPSPETLTFDGGGAVSRVEAEAAFRNEDLEPRGRFTVLRRPMRAEEAEIRALSRARDELPEGRLIHEAVLTYVFELDDPAKVKFGVRMGDEDGAWSSFTSMIWQLFDEGGQLLANGHAGGSEARLGKGEYTVRYHLRHWDVKLLERARDAVGFLDFQLTDPISLSFHAHGDDAYLGADRVKTIELKAGERRALFVPAPPWDDLPAEALPGDVLIGTYTLGLSDGYEKGAGERPGGFPVRLVVPPEAMDYEEDDAVEAEDERSALEKARDAVRDERIAQLAALRDDDEPEAFRTLYQEARKAYGAHVPLLLEWLRFTYGDGPDYEDKRRATRVERAAQAVLDQIDETKLAAALGVKYDPKNPKDLKTKADTETRRKALVEALEKQARLQLAAGKTRRGDFEKTVVRMRRFQDLEKGPYRWFLYELEMHHGHHGKALEILGRIIQDKPYSEKAYRRRIMVAEKLGWDHWAALETRWMLRRFPPGDYPRF